MSVLDAEIANMALGHLGVSTTIENLETERSTEALVCKRFIEIAVEEVLSAPWPFNTKFANLALVEEDPTDEWGFSYRYPSDCLYFRRIRSGIRNDTRGSRIPYRIGVDDQGQLILTDEETAKGEYSVRLESLARVPVKVRLTISYRLAELIAPSVTAGDPFKLGARAGQMYRAEMSMAWATAKNEEQAEDEPEGEFVKARTEG